MDIGGTIRAPSTLVPSAGYGSFSGNLCHELVTTSILHSGWVYYGEFYSHTLAIQGVY